ncbi:hypothetical protein IGI39_004418 [Enterococcus sp. AZ135]
MLGTLGCLFLPMYYQKKVEEVNQTTINSYNKAAKKVDSSVKNYQEKYNHYLAKEGRITNMARPNFRSITTTKEGAIGTLHFPTVRVNETPIYKEKTGEALFYYKYGSFPTAGKNGHLVVQVNDRWRNQNNLIALQQLDVGDHFFLRMDKQRQAYEIIAIEKSQVATVTFSETEQLLTLTMKDLTGFTNEEIGIVSRRVPIKKATDAHHFPRITVSYQAGVIILLLLNSVFFGWLVVQYQRKVQLAQSENTRTKNGGFRQLRSLLKLTRGYYIVLSLIMGFYLAYMLYRIVYLR